MEKNAVRFKLIDTIRGITVISMVIYHAMWDICNIFSVKMPRYSGTPGYVWQQSICITFIFISGFCSYLGKDKRKKLKRGFTVSLCGLVVTFVSLAFMEDTPIYFGILTFIGLMMLISAMLYKPLKYISPIPGAAVSLFLFIILKE